MAESTQDTMSREETLARAERSQQLFAETLSCGTLPVEKEIEMRINLAEFFIKIGTMFSAHKPINDAIQHLDAVLRRLSKDCSDRPNILKELSNAHFESYRLTNSRHSLDNAVLYGLQAKELAIALHLHTHGQERYLEILTHLGYFLSYRFQLIGMPKDLDESIACKREILESTSKGSDSHGLALNNLASALRVRYVNRPRLEDEEEARKLLEELFSSTESGSKLHNIAVGQLGLLATARFHQTQTLEDLDEALVHCKIGLESSLDGDNARLEMLQNIVTLYKAKYEYTMDLEDLKSVVEHSSLLFESTPATRSSRGKSLLQHLQNVQEWALAEESLEVLEHAIGLSEAALASMPDDYQDKALSQLIFTQLLSQRYVLTGTLEGLIPLVDYSALMLTGYNSKIQSGYSTQEVNEDWIWGFSDVLNQLSKPPVDNYMRQMAEEELFGTFLSCRGAESGYYGIAALEEVYTHNGDRLRVLATSAMADMTLSDEDIETEVMKLKEKGETSNQDLLESLLGSKSEYQTEYGQRKLAIDPETNQITFDFTNLARDVLGYEEGGVSPDEFVAREEHMEKESLEKGRSNGEHSNPRLCRWCRHLTKPLKPSEKGFELTADRCIIPTLGDWKMVLYCRGECAVCSLAAAIITTDKGELHADFEKLDQEARGIRMSCGTLSTGESVMRLDFGISYAGELRLLTKENYRQALRQGWEIDESVPFPQLLDDEDGSIYEIGGQQVNFQMINTWLNDCDHNHGIICNHPRPGNRIMSKIPLTFIDIHQKCLVSGTSDDKYFALSYTWGRIDMCMTLKENVERRQRPQGLSEVMFPRTIRDAMKAASQLGVRLLWIDAVCITQDDPADKGKNIPNMDIVYGKAFATIVALSGDNADAGLPGVNPGSRNVQRIESFPITRGSSNLDYNPLSNDYEVVRLVRTPRPFYLALQMSNWNTRGWIMQERLLSRRCIYFSPEAVYFQCGQKTLVEGGVNEEFRTYIHSSPMIDEHVLQKADHDNPVSDLTHMYDLDAGPRLWKAFEVYVRMVREYTKREFSFKGDILNGFAGMFSVLDDEHFQGSIKSTTLNGLPSGIFIHALLWTPAARIPRRGARFPTQADITTGKPDPEFPSWSWAGWDGTVDYPLFQWVTNIEERPVALSQDIQVGGLKLFPDKYEEATYLLQRQGNEISGRNYVQTQDESVIKRTQGSAATILSERVLAVGQNPGSQDTTVTQNGSQTPDSGKAATRSSKGKEKATEEDPQTGKLWQDPDSGKMWLWFTPPGHEEDRSKDGPLPGSILQMKAPVVPLTSFKITPNKEYLTSPTNVHAKGTQSVRRILNSNGKHCGLYWEQGGYEWVGNEIYPEAEKKLIMVAVSSHGVCYRPRQGPSCVEGPVPLFDNAIFRQTGPGSELVNVLVVDEDAGYSDAIGERCTAAVIHINAWEAAQPRVRDVRIA